MGELARYRPKRCIIVIFGASGNLTQRKLAPALYNLAREDLLPEGTVLVGYGRTPMTDDAFRNRLGKSIGLFSRAQPGLAVGRARAASACHAEGRFLQARSISPFRGSAHPTNGQILRRPAGRASG